MEMIKTFAKSESGAVTVDWVVLTAAIVGLGLAVMAVVSGGVEDLAGDIDTQLTGMGIDTTFDGTHATNASGVLSWLFRSSIPLCRTNPAP
jgi:Flp pilus assembly pilin Flp